MGIDMTGEHPACGRPGPEEASAGLLAYAAGIPDGDLRRLLADQPLEWLEELAGLDDTAGRHAYAPGKWSLAALVGHVADTELVFFERALRAARGDDGEQPGFDEDRFAAAWEPRLGAELDRWRAQRKLLARWAADLEEEAWLRRGRAAGRFYTVRALLAALAGHAAHHLDVLRGRYRAGLPDCPRRGLEAELDGGLSLRQVGLADVPELDQVCREERERLGRWLPWATGPVDPSMTRRFAADSREAWLAGGLPNLALRVRGRLSGMIGLNPVQAGCAHIGYWIAAREEGRGHVRSAVRWLTAQGFERLGLDRVEIRCAVDNRRSRAVPESLGFRLEGILRAGCRVDRGPEDLALYAVTTNDWPALREAWAAAPAARATAAPVQVLRGGQAEQVLDQAGCAGWRLGQDGERRLVRVRLEPGARLAPHPVPDRALFWVVSGRGRLHVEQQELAMAAGDAALVEAGAARGWMCEGDAPLEIAVVRGWPAP